MTELTTTAPGAAHAASWKWFLALGVVLVLLGLAGAGATTFFELTSLLVFVPLLFASSLIQLLTARQQLADRGPLAGFVDGRGVPGLEQQFVGKCTSPSIGAKERLHVALQCQRQARKVGPLAKPGQRQIHQQVLAAPAGDRVPGLRLGDPQDGRPGALQRGDFPGSVAFSTEIIHFALNKLTNRSPLNEYLTVVAVVLRSDSR